MGFGPTPHQPHAGEAVAAKNRVISDSARGANHLPIIGKPTERVAAKTGNVLSAIESQGFRK
jgi:hypothetical protein